MFEFFNQVSFVSSLKMTSLRNIVSRFLMEHQCIKLGEDRLVVDEQKVLDLIELVLSFEVQNWQPLLYIFRPLPQPSNLLPGLIRSRHIFAFHFIFLWRVRIPKRKVYALNFLALHHVVCLLQLFIIGIDVEAKPLNKHFSK